MKTYIYGAAVLAAVATAAPAPLQKRDNIDETILNYALTLEHLEAAFYKEGLAKYKEADFMKAGFKGKDFYNKLKKVAQDEAVHVTTIETIMKAAGYTPTKACKYAFGYKDAASFITTASILEGVGVTAYLGAAAKITDPAYLTAAGSILTVEARHNAWIRNAKMQSPFPQAFDTPLDFDQVYSLASPFIVSCPEDNPKLPVKAFPKLTPKGGPSFKKSADITFTIPKGSDYGAGPFYVAWPAVTGPIFQAATVDGAAGTVKSKIPKGTPAGPAGQAYAVLTTSSTELTDENTVAGPAIVNVMLGVW